MSADTAASSRPDRLPPRGLRSAGFAANLARRVATSLVVLPALLAVFFLAPPWAAVTLVAVALALGLHEFFGLLRARGLSPLPGAGWPLAALLFLEVGGLGPPGGSAWPLGALLLLALALRRGVSPESVSAAAGTLLGAVYLGGLGGTIAALVLLRPVEEGPWRIALLFAIVMISDSFAFFVGHAVGRRRLAPAISPGKSVEGAVGGLLGGVLGALLVRGLALPALPLAHALGLGVVAAAMGIVGDLDESLLKRWAGVKDSGTLFPGHGGMLDRLDSLLFAAPVLYYYFQYAR